MPARAQVRAALDTAQVEAGYAQPNAMLQYALPGFDKAIESCRHAAAA